MVFNDTEQFSSAFGLEDLYKKNHFIHRQGKQAPPPGVHVLKRIETILVADHQRNICAKLFFKSCQYFCTRFLKMSLYTHTMETSPVPWRPCFLTDRNHLNNLC